MLDLVENPEDRFSRDAAPVLQDTVSRMPIKFSLSNEPTHEKITLIDLHNISIFKQSCASIRMGNMSGLCSDVS